MSDKLDEDKSKYERFGERLEGVRKELEQRTNEVVSLREEKQEMQEKYQEEMSNSKLRVECLNEECSLLKIELEKRSGDSRHGSATKSAETEEHLVSLATRIRELQDTLTTKDSECYALQKTVTSLQSELKEAQDLLASKLETPSKFGESLVESVHLSLPPDYTRKDFSYKNFQSVG